MANYTNHLVAEEHPNWRGDDGTYRTKHSWARRNFPMTGKCSHCDQASSDLANVDHKYRRVLSDWIELCRQCHVDYDIANGLRDPKGAAAKVVRVLVTHCRQGHEYTDENTYRNPRSNKRSCRTCHRITEWRRRRGWGGREQ